MKTNHKYWYLDNWSGKKKLFNTLREAKFSAKIETGISITIYDSDSKIVEIVNASGYVPA